MAAQTFASFVTGPSNREAYEQARAISAGIAGGRPGRVVLLQGRSGCGKTHLLKAAAADASVLLAPQVVIDVHAEDLRDQLVASVRCGEPHLARVTAPRCRLMIVDGLEVLAGRPTLQGLAAAAFEEITGRNVTVLTSCAVASDLLPVLRSPEASPVRDLACSLRMGGVLQIVPIRAPSRRLVVEILRRRSDLPVCTTRCLQDIAGRSLSLPAALGRWHRLVAEAELQAPP